MGQQYQESRIRQSASLNHSGKPKLLPMPSLIKRHPITLAYRTLLTEVDVVYVLFNRVYGRAPTKLNNFGGQSMSQHFS